MEAINIPFSSRKKNRTIHCISYSCKKWKKLRLLVVDSGMFLIGVAYFLDKPCFLLDTCMVCEFFSQIMSNLFSAALSFFI